MGLSVSYLSSLFSKYQPPGFSHYLRQYRVEQARLLLESTDASVTEIGYQTGFNSSNSFIRTFKSLWARRRAGIGSAVRAENMKTERMMIHEKGGQMGGADSGAAADGLPGHPPPRRRRRERRS